MEIDKESFRRMFPNLYREVEGKDHSVKIGSVRSDLEDGEREAAKNLEGFMPGVIDFIRRCNELKEAEEIILYMKSRGEIEEEYANKLLNQLKEKGLQKRRGGLLQGRWLKRK
ncbi:MAG: DUF2095 family protein [Candidatus Bathyarchaeia archaeon]